MAYGAGEALVIEEVQVSPPQAMEIRIKVVSTSLCRSDITAWSQVISSPHEISSSSFPIPYSYFLMPISLTSDLLHICLSEKLLIIQAFEFNLQLLG